MRSSVATVDEYRDRQNAAMRKLNVVRAEAEHVSSTGPSRVLGCGRAPVSRTCCYLHSPVGLAEVPRAGGFRDMVVSARVLAEARGSICFVTLQCILGCPALTAGQLGTCQRRCGLMV